MKSKKFFPEEIIFSATGQCNLACPHCFVTKSKTKLSSEKAIKFLETCKGTTVRKVGFSGGEPFLNLDFLCDVIKYSVDNAFLFDRIMTNGSWWKNSNELKKALEKIKDAGFDGKIGLSFDSFHGQSLKTIKEFCKTVYEYFDGSTIEIQSVRTKFSIDIKNIEFLAAFLDCKVESNLDKNTGLGTMILKGKDKFIPVYVTPQSFKSNDSRAFNSSKWFTDDFCAGPGQILFVHPNGKIAPCCGFANENEALIIGTIEQDFDTVLQQARENKMVKICYDDGLSTQIKELKKQGISVPGKTDDICTFCNFICKL